MKHKVKVTVLDKKYYPELQQQYCADPNSGVCPCYNVGDVYEFYRDGIRDDYWHLGINTLVKTNGDADTTAGGPKLPFCSMGRHLPLHLYWSARWLYHEGLDEK